MPAVDVDAAYNDALAAFDRAISALDDGDVEAAAVALDEAAAAVRDSVADGVDDVRVAALTAAWRDASGAAAAARARLEIESREVNANARARRAYTAPAVR